MKYLYSVLACLIYIVVAGKTVNAQETYIHKVASPAFIGLHSIDSLNELAFKLKRNDTNKALSLLGDALNLSLRQKYKKGEAVAYLYQAGIYQQNGYSKRALSLYFKSLEISSNSKDTFNIARANQQIGSALMDASDFKGAEKLYKAALHDYILLNEKEDVVNVYNSLGLLNIIQKDIPAAERYLNRALEEGLSINYFYGIKKSHFHLGRLYLAKNDLFQAEEQFNKAIALDKEKNDKYGLSLSYNKLATIYSIRKDYSKALQMAQEALQKAGAISAIQLEIEATENIVDIYKAQKDYEKVMEWQSSLVGLHKQLSEKEKSYAINFLDVLKEKQEEQLAYEKHAFQAEQKHKLTNLVLLIVSIALAVIAIVAPMWYKNYLKVKAFSKELSIKNEEIESYAHKLEDLNKEVSRQNESLEGTNKMKDKLLSIISHDLRGPLMNTKGVLQIINSGVLKQEEQVVLLEELDKQYTKSVVLLDNMLFWIKSQMRGDKIELRNLEVKSLIQSIVEEQEATRKGKEITILNEVSPEIAVLGDKEMLKVVFRNLLSNALKFTKDGGKIIIKSSLGASANIIFQDEGVGMSQENLERIQARRYFTTHGTKNEAGSGFGLMICWDLIQRNGGELQIKSTLNKGSQFTVKLPVPTKSAKDMKKELSLLA